ncbi:MAG: CDP-alcohol phosphatidyltransferase family protein [Clostridia bacterium]|nr:CDP-alcohol phosphatidyltransferase family protein [Clostridia bacterium]
MKLRKQITVPNILTLIRFFFIPVMANYILAGDDFRVLAFFLYFGIWSTDLLDGYIARHFHQMTDLGKLMDPFVDKVMQFTAAVTLYGTGKVPFWLPVFVAVKEVLMMIGTAVVLRSRRQVVYAKWYGKLATFAFVAGSGAVVLMDTRTASRYSTYIFLPVILLSCLAAYQYVIGGIRMLTGRPRPEEASGGPLLPGGEGKDDRPGAEEPGEKDE